MELAKSWMKHQPSPYQQRDITHFPDWRDLIVLDAYFNNMTAGLMLVTTIVWAAGGAMLGILVPFALTIALALLIIDLCLLIADLGDSAHFIHSLRVMRFTSPLSVGVWGLSCYGIFLGLACIFTWIVFSAYPSDSLCFYVCNAFRRLCMVMAACGAIVVVCYKGVAFSCTSQPGLCQARWLPPFMVADALLMGMAILDLIAVMLGAPLVALPLVMPTIALLIARCIAFAVLYQDVKPRADKVYSKGRRQYINWMVYGLGGLLPLILVFCGEWGLTLAAILILIVGLLERAWLIALTRPYPEQD